MRLISLSASESSFKKVTFNKKGVSFILAEQSHPEQSDNSKTYNGVGKSLLVALVNFCLGAATQNKISKSLLLNLPEWHFILNIEINNKPHEIIRYVNRSNLITFDKEEQPLSDFYNTLESLCFALPVDVSYLSFRSLLPFFLRPSKQSYLNYADPQGSMQPYQKQLYNAFLLGLDVYLVQEKKRLKKELDETNKLQKNIANDPILKKFFEGHQDSSLAIAELKEKIHKLEADLEAFEVAEDYYQVKSEADSIKSNIDKTHNDLTLKRMNIDNIHKSLQIAPDVSRQEIKSIYTESKLVFHSSFEKELSELESFYRDLTINRTKRLENHKKLILADIKRLEEQAKFSKIRLNEALKFLDAHKALDVFTKMTKMLSEFQQRREKLLGFEKLQHDYEQKKVSLKKSIISETEKTTKYLDEIKDETDAVMENFRGLVKQFYPDALAGITIKTNDGTNQTRYNIDAKIQSDSSDGINSVKLFCYDMTLLLYGSNHNMKFVFHDSRLFSDIDEPHCDVLFKILQHTFTPSGEYQYIASINQNQLNALSPDTQAFVKEHTVQSLTDDSDDGKLLGITVELEYD